MPTRLRWSSHGSRSRAPSSPDRGCLPGSSPGNRRGRPIRRGSTDAGSRRTGRRVQSPGARRRSVRPEPAAVSLGRFWVVAAGVAGSGGGARGVPRRPAPSQAVEHRRAAGNRAATAPHWPRPRRAASAVASRRADGRTTPMASRDRRRLVDDDRDFAAEIEAERRQRQAADDRHLVVDQHHLAVRLQPAQPLGAVDLDGSRPSARRAFSSAIRSGSDSLASMIRMLVRAPRDERRELAARALGPDDQPVATGRRAVGRPIAVGRHQRAAGPSTTRRIVGHDERVARLAGSTSA